MFANSQKGRICLSVLAIGASFLPVPGTAWSGYNNVTIVELTTYQAPAIVGVLIKFSPATPNLEGCSYSAGDYAWIDTAQADGKATYATVLAAHLAGRSVSIGVHGCTAEGQPRVYGVTVPS
jgi:hypothetical protein